MVWLPGSLVSLFITLWGTVESLSFQIVWEYSAQILLLLESELLTERSHLDLPVKVISHSWSSELPGSLE